MPRFYENWKFKQASKHKYQISRGWKELISDSSNDFTADVCISFLTSWAKNFSLQVGMQDKNQLVKMSPIFNIRIVNIYYYYTIPTNQPTPQLDTAKSQQIHTKFSQVITLPSWCDKNQSVHTHTTDIYSSYSSAASSSSSTAPSYGYLVFYAPFIPKSERRIFNQKQATMNLNSILFYFIL